MLIYSILSSSHLISHHENTYRHKHFLKKICHFHFLIACSFFSTWVLDNGVQCLLKKHSQWAPMTCKFNTQRYSDSFHKTVFLWHFWLCPLLSFSYCFYFSVSLTGLSSFWFSRTTVTLFVKHFTHYIVFTYITSFVFKETQVSNLPRIILSGWDGWMASLTKRTWVWVDSGSWWWTGRPGVLQSMGSQSRTQLSD